MFCFNESFNSINAPSVDLAMCAIVRYVIVYRVGPFITSRSTGNTAILTFFGRQCHVIGNNDKHIIYCLVRTRWFGWPAPNVVDKDLSDWAMHPLST